MPDAFCICWCHLDPVQCHAKILAQGVVPAIKAVKHGCTIVEAKVVEALQSYWPAVNPIYL